MKKYAIDRFLLFGCNIGFEVTAIFFDSENGIKIRHRFLETCCFLLDDWTSAILFRI